MLHNPDILLSLSGLVVSQPLSQSLGRGFESQKKCWDFSSLKNRAIVEKKKKNSEDGLILRSIFKLSQNCQLDVLSRTRL